MPVTLKTRKPVVKLTATDLRIFPVWEYALDEEDKREQDETWVRPVASAAIRNGVYVIVATDFATHSGRELRGFMIVSTLGGKVEIRAGAVVGRIGYRVIPTLSRKLAAARKCDWALRERDNLVEVLGEPETAVFPMQYALRVPIRGEKQTRQGILR